MADFCKKCSEKLLGEDTKDLAGISSEEDTARGFYVRALCEGCGPIFVDHEGVCVTTGCPRCQP